MLDITCLGELLTDMISTTPDASLAEAVSFTKSPGGAPANVACGAARLGMRAAFLGMVGADPFGDYLKRVVADVGVDVSGLCQTDDVRTTLAFIATRRDGRKDVTFFPKAGADTRYAPECVDEGLIRQSRVFHFGSISLRHEPSRSGTLHALKVAREAGCLVAYDPNFRPALWDDHEEARRWMLFGLGLADVVKIADEEWEMATGTGSHEAGAAEVLSQGPRLLVVTQAERGACWYSRDHSGHVDACPVTVVDPLGAGDAFTAALVKGLLDSGAEGIPSESQMRRILTYANAAGALTTQKVGVIPSLPTWAEVEAFAAQG
ncbi:MAG TPA: PfkB family carbohydrate kinase [Armatimonadota bacterium]|jgi:fructokinase